MKKERVVGLCICFVLLASVQAQRVFSWYYQPNPSFTQSVWAIASGEGIWNMVYSWVNGNRKSDPVSTFVCTGWPPLSVLYREMRLMKADARHSNERKMAEKHPPQKETLQDWLKQKSEPKTGEPDLQSHSR
jgi:hypothetical protein